MSETQKNPYNLPPNLEKRFNQFAKIDDTNKRFERIIELGKKLSKYPEEEKTENHQVKGCASLTYINGELNNGLIYYRGWSNSHLVLGLLALLVEGLSGISPSEVLAVNPEFIEGMGLSQTLTASRANGFINTFNKMQAIARAQLSAELKS
jgi:cysteine desulfuration protein SufE